MIDYARITVTAGKGGDGGSSQRHLKGKRYGKADGGNGGNGGNVFIEASQDINTLEKYRYVKDYRAENGKPGLGKLSRGAAGADLILKVPVGTQVTVVDDRPQVINSDNDEDEPIHDPKSIIYDLTQDGQQALVARAGQGGRGNAHIKDEFGRRPYKGEKGTPGEIVNLVLELKTIAQIGLIGLPNAGKSTLLAALTSAHPKIANYPFTTLEPNLGVMDREPTIPPSHHPTNLVLADIPGLIEGASQGKGLGHQFLRHIERTKVLLHIIDISQALDNPDTLWTTYQTVKNELKNYQTEVAQKKEIIVLTKTDLVPKETVEKALELFKSHRKKVIAISAQTGEGLELLSQALQSLLR